MELEKFEIMFQNETLLKNCEVHKLNNGFVLPFIPI